MITVLTLTYQRSHILEEAIESFLCQNFDGEREMLIINDSDIVEYVFKHPNVRIINVKNRFKSIWEKLKFGIDQAKYDYIYRLDDDDLLTPWALKNSWEDITNNPDYEVYRSNGHYLFVHNKFIKVTGNINNGNIYTKKYISRIEMINTSSDEDAKMTFNFNANIYTSIREEKTMIYRWGMGTYHISGMGTTDNTEVLTRTDELVNDIAKQRNSEVERGVVYLSPHLKEDYYSSLKTNTHLY